MKKLTEKKEMKSGSPIVPFAKAGGVHELVELKLAPTTNVRPDNLNYHANAGKYDDEITRSIPKHRELHEQISKIVAQRYKAKKIKMLELGLGTGITSGVVLAAAGAGSTLRGIDFSTEMLAEARRKLAKYGELVELIYGDYAELPLGAGYDLAVTVLGIHHQTDDGKKLMFKRTAESLKTGGMFILGDLMTHRDGHKAALNDALHYAFLVQNATDAKMLEEWAYHHKFLNQLAPVEDQIQWLLEAGFSKAELVFSEFNTALVVAVK